MATSLIVRLRNFDSGVIVLVGIVLIWKPFSVSAEVSADQVRATVENVVAILQDQRLKPIGQQNQRQTRLRQMIESKFDVEEMAKRALGPHWKERTPDEQDKFVRLFTDLLADAYLAKLETYVGDKFVYVRETQESDFSEVVTKIIGKNGGQFGISYKLHCSNGDWKVYDLMIENVSLVNNYRSQFNRILAAAPFDELLNGLEQRKGRELSAQRSPLNTIISYWIVSAASGARRQ